MTWPDGVSCHLRVGGLPGGPVAVIARVRTERATTVDGLGVRLRRDDHASRLLVDGFHSWDWAGTRDAGVAGEGWWSCLWGRPGEPASWLRVQAGPGGDGPGAVRWSGDGALDAVVVGPPRQETSRTGPATGLRRRLAAGDILATIVTVEAPESAEARAARPLTRPRPPAGPRVHGWMSWNCLGAEVRAADVRAAVGLVPPGGVLLVDDGWERLWGDWREAPRFGGGLAELAAGLRSQGRGLGVWVAPFSVDCEAEPLDRLRGALLLDGDGEPVVDHRPPRPQYVVDASTHLGEAHLRALGRTLGSSGAAVLKADFLYQACLPRSPLGDPDAMHRLDAGVRAIAEGFREAAGATAHLWACGAPGPPLARLVDACRSGGDAVVNVPGLHADAPPQPWFLCGEATIRAQERNLAARSWLWGAALPADVDAITAGSVGGGAAVDDITLRRWVRLLRRSGGPVLDADLPDGSGLGDRRTLVEALLGDPAPPPQRPCDPLAMPPAPPDDDDLLAWQDGLPDDWEPVPS